MTTDAVRAQYEAYPYPARDPADEAKRLITGSPSHILELDHSVFAGRRDFSRPFRVLVAGGGTGDGTIMLAQQLADAGCPADMLYIDVSDAARAIAEARAKTRGLDGIRFARGSLLDLPDDAGPFDYIDCCGVLHHLDDPAAGLRTLARVLADDGGMGLMVYGALGRTGVYPAQTALRMLAEEEDPPADRVAFARRLMEQLPPTNWLKCNPFVSDHLDAGDAGLFDLLLHSRDRAYTVPEVAELAGAAGLAITTFIEPARYDPTRILSDGVVLGRLGRLPWLERCAVAELLAGNLRKHIAYLVKADRAGSAVADPADMDAIPRLREMEGPELARRMQPGGTLGATFDGLAVRYPLPPLAAAMVDRMDGRRTVGEIGAELRAIDSGLDSDAFARQFRQLHDALNGLGHLFLSRTPVPKPGP